MKLRASYEPVITRAHHHTSANRSKAPYATIATARDHHASVIESSLVVSLARGDAKENQNRRRRDSTKEIRTIGQPMVPISDSAQVKQTRASSSLPVRIERSSAPRNHAARIIPPQLVARTVAPSAPRINGARIIPPELVPRIEAPSAPRSRARVAPPLRRDGSFLARLQWRRHATWFLPSFVNAVVVLPCSLS